MTPKPHLRSRYRTWPDKPLTAHRVYQLVRGRQEDDRSVLDLMAAFRSLEEQLEVRQRLIEDIFSWFQGLAAEPGSDVFELADRVEALVSNPANSPEEDA